MCYIRIELKYNSLNVKMITRHFNNLPVSRNLLSNLDNLKNTFNIKINKPHDI